MIQSVASEKRRVHDEYYLPKLQAPPRMACDDVMTAAIAMLSDNEVEWLTREDILHTIWSARNVPRSPVKAEQITGLDDARLRRVLYHVRRWMRKRIDELSSERGWTPFFGDGV